MGWDGARGVRMQSETSVRLPLSFEPTELGPTVYLLFLCSFIVFSSNRILLNYNICSSNETISYWPYILYINTSMHSNALIRYSLILFSFLNSINSTPPSECLALKKKPTSSREVDFSFDLLVLRVRPWILQISARKIQLFTHMHLGHHTEQLLWTLSHLLGRYMHLAFHPHWCPSRSCVQSIPLMPTSLHNVILNVCLLYRTSVNCMFFVERSRTIYTNSFTKFTPLFAPALFNIYKHSARTFYEIPYVFHTHTCMCGIHYPLVYDSDYTTLYELWFIIHILLRGESLRVLVVAIATFCNKSCVHSAPLLFRYYYYYYSHPLCASDAQSMRNM